jgi:two-component system, LytTR family, sensor kinase
MFSNKYRYAFIALLSVYTYLNTAFCQIYHYFSIEIEWYYAFSVIFCITLITWEGSRLIENLFLKTPAPERRESHKRLLLFFFAGTAISMAAAVIAVITMGVLILGQPLKNQFIPFKLTITYATLANLLFHLVNAAYHYLKQYKTKELEAEELKRINMQAQLQAVNNQINPHFLFNNLNVLSGLVLTDPKEANRFTEAFSQVYRYILSAQDKELVAVSDELDFIQPYLFLLQKRFPGGLNITMEVSDEAKKLYMVPAALQMLIENAIKHNVASSSRPLSIDIYANGKQVLRVKNNLQPKITKEVSSSIGLQNINQRYGLLFQKSIIIENEAGHFMVELPLINISKQKMPEHESVAY